MSKDTFKTRLEIAKSKIFKIIYSSGYVEVMTIGEPQKSDKEIKEADALKRQKEAEKK